MNKTELINSAVKFIEVSKSNYVTKEVAISDAVAGMKIYEDPVFAFGDAGDEYFTRLKDPVAIGSHFRLPKEWLPRAKTVISFFLPYTAAIKKDNSLEETWPSDGWLHGRYEGQMLLNKLSEYLQNELLNAGYLSIVPSLDKGFWSKGKPGKGLGKEDQLSFTSNWSERHVAFVCGLGSFGLSKGLITSKGIAGRFGSIVTELEISPSGRDYTEIDEYCSMCGDCVKQCPVNAISLENGKDHLICCEFLDITKKKYKPRYGCGKCQVSVSCESCIPA
ncbi:MAG: 4Fe-4S binding protein [Dethiobacter sp.]|jgi:epoxyqueuosine reductase QueG|nr:4Fe-4S binding protein [Dethiobacter sp.]